MAPAYDWIIGNSRPSTTPRASGETTAVAIQCRHRRRRSSASGTRAPFFSSTWMNWLRPFMKTGKRSAGMSCSSSASLRGQKVSGMSSPAGFACVAIPYLSRIRARAASGGE
ncbi:MAG: hypothetical protein QM704_26485 [Anaeromyxobacteraceae bacterium]